MRLLGVFAALCLSGCAHGLGPGPLGAGVAVGPMEGWGDTTPSGPLYAAPRNVDGRPDRSAEVRQDQAANDAIGQRGADSGVAADLTKRALAKLRAETQAGFSLPLSRPLVGDTLTFEAFVLGARGRLVSVSGAGTRLEISADTHLTIALDGQTLRTQQPVLDGAWQHLGVRVSGREVVVTRNQSIVAELAFAAPLALSGEVAVQIGGFEGALDEVALYDAGLAAPELFARGLVAEGFLRPRAKPSSLPIELVTHPATLELFAVTMSGSGRYAATAGSGGAAILWDARTGEAIRSFAGPMPGVTMGLDIDPSERLIAMTGGYTTVHDLETGAVLRAFPGGGTKVVFGGGGRWVAVAANLDGGMLNGFIVYRVDDGNEIARETLDGGGMILAMAASEGEVYVGTASGRLSVFRLRAGGLRQRAGFKTKMPMIQSISRSPDGRLVALAGVGAVQVREDETFDLVDAFMAKRHSGQSVSFADNDRLAIAQGPAQPALLVNPRTGDKLGEVAGLVGPSHVAARGDRVLAASLTVDGLYGTDGTLVHGLGAEDAQVAQVSFSPDGRALVLATKGRRASRFDLSTGRLDATIDGAVVGVGGDGRTVLLADGGGQAFNLDTQARTAISGGGMQVGLRVAAYAGGVVYASQAFGSGITLGVYDARGARTVATFPATGLDDPLSVDAAGRRALCGKHLVDLVSGRVTTVEGVSGGALSPNGDRVYAASRGREAPGLLDVQGRVLWTEPQDWAVGTGAYSPNGRLVGRAGWYRRELVLRDAGTGRELKRLALRSLRPDRMVFSPDGRHVVVAAREGYIELLAVDGGARHTIVQRGSDWVILDDAERFAGSRHAHRMLSAVQGGQILGLEQIAIARNRPDLVLKSLPGADPDALAYYAARVAARRAVRGAKAGGTPPKARILGVKIEGRGATVEVAHASDEGLRSARAWANGAPLPSIALEGRAGRATHTFDLLPGPNRVEVSAIDVNGLESSRALTSLDGPPGPVGRLVYLGLGVSAYAQPELALGYAHADARAIGEALQKLSPYAKVEATVRVDREVQVGAIEALMAAAKATRPEDTLVLFAAGHGLHDRDAAATYYFLSQGADPARLAETAIPLSRFEALLEAAPARKKIFFLDTCESGELDGAGVAAAGLPTGARSRAARGLKRLAPTHKAPRRYVLDRERFLYRDLERRSGAIVFASSRGDELSYESDEIGNGYFTRGLLDALSGKGDDDDDGVLSIEELRGYVSREVAARSGDRQHPVIDRENLHQGFGLALRADRAFETRDPLDVLVGYWRLNDKETRRVNQARGATGSEVEAVIAEYGAAPWAIAHDRILAPTPGFFHVAERGASHVRLKVAAERRYGGRFELSGKSRMCLDLDHLFGKRLCYDRAAYLGVQRAPAPNGSGASVVAVVPGSPANALGLKAGDVITEVSGTPIQTPDGLDAAVRGLVGQGSIRVKYLRGGAAREGTTRLSPPAPPAPATRAERRARVKRVPGDDGALVETVLDAVPRRWHRTFDAMGTPGRIDLEVRPRIDLAACRFVLERTSRTTLNSNVTEQENRMTVDLMQVDPSTVKRIEMRTMRGTVNAPAMRALFADSYPGDWAMSFEKNGQADDDGHSFDFELLADEATEAVSEALAELVVRCQSR